MISQNPGLANPEISKIIGAQWRDQPVDVKNEWKRLAEVCWSPINLEGEQELTKKLQEEKQRHQRQYPDYRYQPRRAGKLNGSRTTPSLDNPLRCPKCNGRYISTPNTPLTPFPPTPSIGTRNERLASPFSRPAGDAMDIDRNYSNPPPSSTPRNSQIHFQPPQRRPPFPVDHHSGRPYRNDDSDMMQSPRKRPRPNDLQSSYSSPGPAWFGGPQRLVRPPIVGPSYNDRPRGVIYQQHPNTGMMEPPPRPTPLTGQFPRPNTPGNMRPQNMDDLRLPPLQTQLSGPGQVPGQQPQRNNSLSHLRSIEAMVMTIPFLNKIKVLSKIAPPLATPGPTSPAVEIRGPVIAVEGPDRKLVAEVGRYIEECLSKEGEYIIKTWTSDQIKPSESRSGDVTMGGTSKEPPPAIPAIDLTKDEEKDLILQYISDISNWHHRSAEIKEFITTLPVGSSSSPAHSQSSSRSNSSGAASKPSISPSCSPTTTPAQPPNTTTTTRAARMSRLPIALLPNGYSLSISDRAASKIPIVDAYAPVDHWQWMATLWRGIIGVDLTIYVNPTGRGDEEVARGLGAPPLGGGVEVKNDARAIVVQAQNGKVEERVLRRLGFEILEFIRGVGSGLDTAKR